MRKFKINGNITVGTYTTVEAENKEEALELAKERHDMMFISTNNGDEPEYVWMVDELDGTPFNLTIED